MPTEFSVFTNQAKESPMRKIILGLLALLMAVYLVLPATAQAKNL